MSLQTELQTIRTGKLAPIYLVLGTETYLRERFKETLHAQVLADDDADLNSASFDMLETPLGLAVDEAQTLPFFGDYRLVTLENPYFLTGQKKVGGPEHDVELLSEYLANPLPSTVLVIYATYDKLDERKKVVKLLKKQATLIDVKTLGEKDVRHYLRQSLTATKQEITPEAFELVLRLTEMDLSKAMGELDKLMLYTGQQQKITVPIVESLVPKSLEHNIFEMVTYVLAGQTEQALTLFHDLRLQGEDGIKINAILISHFRLLIQINIMQGKGYQQSNMADVLKIHPYRIKLASQQARRFSLAQVQESFDKLVTNDYRMKTGQMDKDLLFELFVLEFGAARQ